MKIQVMERTFAGGGTASPFWIAGILLEDGAPDFGPNPNELFIQPFFRNVRDPLGIPKHVDAYNKLLSKLPKLRVLNNSKLVEIHYLSNVCTDDAFKRRTYISLAQREKVEAEHGPQHLPFRPYNADLFRPFCAELLEILPNFRKRLAKVEGFDFDRFLEWAAVKFKELPNSDESLKDYAMAWHSKPKEQKKAEGWDDLLLDWSKYHPQAREILNDLFYWDCVNEYAPHGNDEGADVLEHFEHWRKRNKTGDSKKFFERLMREWGASNHPEDKLHDTYELSLIGLAFAHLKVDAACPSWVRDEAVKVLREQRNSVKAPESAEELVGRLDMMIKKLEEH